MSGMLTDRTQQTTLPLCSSPAGETRGHDAIAGVTCASAIEIGAYERLWCELGATVRSMADRFRSSGGASLAEMVPESIAHATCTEVIGRLGAQGALPAALLVFGHPEYPTGLRDARSPFEALWTRGDRALLTHPLRVSVVGTRKPTDDGHRRASRLVRELHELGATIVSGLAAGIDTVAHQTALTVGARTLAVIGTPIDKAYPRENAALQEQIATDQLLVSPVPVLRYYAEGFRANRLWFLERNKVMSALSHATVIVEAGETSGTHVQARAGIEQGRKVFVLHSNFERPDLKWPAQLEKLGAIRVRTTEDIAKELA